MRRNGRRGIGAAGIDAVVVMMMMTVWAGCTNSPGGLIGGSGSVEDGNRGDATGDGTGKTQGEPNDSFDQALTALFDAQGKAALQGTISTINDADVFAIGSIQAGDHLVVEAGTPGSSLDVAVAVFDNAGRLVYYNDDRSTFSLDAEADFVARHDGDPYFVVVAPSSFAGSGAGDGTYTVDVTVEPGGDVPPPVGQVILLDFEGGLVDSPALGRIRITAFDAGKINVRYEGQTDELKSLITESVIQNFERFNVIVLTSDDPPPDADMQFSTVYLGGFSQDIFGEAEDVDLYNQDYCDDAIIYTESFDPDAVFRRPPSTAALARAIGNVTAHEAGHLLGLNHVDDDDALMDEESTTEALTRDQEFMEAVLSNQIAPIGTQDAVLLLSETLGTIQ